MALNELSRHELHTRLRGAIGEQAAATLMEYLPPVGWADVATKRDVDALAVLTKRDLDALEQRTGLLIEALEERMGLRMEALEERMGLRMEALEERMGLRMKALEHRLGERIEGLRSDFRTEISTALTSQTRTVVLAAIGSNLTIAGIAFAASLLR